ncbi:hypothetical protein BHYA_0154g00140 [Botrytis hyacinthi]|uniref:Uncharacterized protein n=1 Tax=Botrytis hyacinthi TaxID=278943 RepID=A0A4Z1GJ63_9HELO|nr:hypothetical protein BHYA_0154g00140 [Botrytis hyacinthi]
MNPNQETLSSSADVKGTVAKPATDLGNLPVTTTALVTMDPHIELELLRIDHRSTIDQERIERLDSINGISTAPVVCDTRDRGSLLPGIQSAVVEKESLSSERSMVAARFARRRGRGRKNQSGDVVVVQTIASYWIIRHFEPKCNGDLTYANGIDSKGVPYPIGDVAVYNKRLQQERLGGLEGEEQHEEDSSDEDSAYEDGAYEE